MLKINGLQGINRALHQFSVTYISVSLSETCQKGNFSMAKLKPIEFASVKSVKTSEMPGTIVVPVAQGADGKPTLSDAGAKLNAVTEGRIVRAMEVEKFEGGRGKSAVLIAPTDKIRADRVVLFGIGKEEDRKPGAVEKIERIGGEMAAAIIGFDSPRISVLADGISASVLHPMTMGFALRHYTWGKNTDKKTEASRAVDTVLQIATSGTRQEIGKLSAAYHQEAGLVVPTVHMVRDLVNMRANELNTEQLRDSAVEAAGKAGLSVSVMHKSDLERHGMGAILAVGQGSKHEPYVVVMKHRGDPSSSNIYGLVGKGLVYDTGGLSMKPSAGMFDMNCDMGGSAAVLGAMVLLAEQKVCANVIGIMGIAENVTDGDSYRLRDILKTMSGQTVEVDNTDAEGRLVLADCLTLAQQQGAKSIIEASTLTGACIVALGNSYAGLMTLDDPLAGILEKASRDTGEPLWRLPMNSDYDECLKSGTGQADMTNIGPPNTAGASMGAHFLQRFIKPGTRFAHLDIAPMAWLAAAKGIYPKGASGYGPRLMAQAIRGLVAEGRKR